MSTTRKFRITSGDMGCMIERVEAEFDTKQHSIFVYELKDGIWYPLGQG